METGLPFNQPAKTTERQTWFVNVILPFALQRPFTYRVPQNLKEGIEPGKRVIVQFGKKKIYTALIHTIHQTPPKAYTAKYLLEILDEQPIVYGHQLEFWDWVADYYCAPIGSVMDAALPANLKLESETQVTINEDEQAITEELDEKEWAILEALREQGTLTLSNLESLMERKGVFSLIQSMHKKGLIQLKEEIQKGYKPKTKTFVRLKPDYQNQEALKALFQELANAPKQIDVLMAYQVLSREQEHVGKKEVTEKAGTTAGPVKSLAEKEILEFYEKTLERLAWDEPEQVSFDLDQEQQRAYQEIQKYFETYQTVLLHGVTGSGKTHVYMNLIEETINAGKQALYLVPEIALTTQLIRRLRNYFGNAIGIYHSRFSANERVEIWYKVLNGEYKVVLGVRSALFLPFQNLDLIVVDEEHEGTFKQNDPAPRYHARDSAIYMSHLFGGKTLLGTGTPSFESFFNARNGKYGLVSLNKRYGDVRLPNIEIVNLKAEYKKNKMKSEFSSVLYKQIKENLENDYQNILFQNRRGYSPFIQCQTCGWVPECKNCDISLTYHKYYKEIRCHLCGYREANPGTCKACGSTEIKMVGFGTEKLEDELKTLFPETNILRLDQDTTSRKNAYSQIISEFENGNAGILVGTQMVTKGLDFQNVRLVGIASADQMLKYPDFRANERSFHLMLQVSGRSGRKDKQGAVIIQTFLPEHPIFRFLQQYDYEGFYEHEIYERLKFKYPPFYRLVKLHLKAKDLDKIKEGSNVLANRLKQQFEDRVLGPELPPVMRVKNNYLMNILIKFEKKNYPVQKAKHTMMNVIADFQKEPDFKTIRINIDVDPL